MKNSTFHQLRSLNFEIDRSCLLPAGIEQATLSHHSFDLCHRSFGTPVKQDRDNRRRDADGDGNPHRSHRLLVGGSKTSIVGFLSSTYGGIDQKNCQL